MIKKIFIISTFIICSSAFAQKDKIGIQILKCLGAEEFQYHKNHQTGILYKLNQKLISEFILLGSTDVKEEYLSIICDQKKTASFELLKQLIYHGKDILTYRTKDPMRMSMASSNSDEFIERVPEILSQFISSIQANAPTPDCLEKNIPGLKELNYELKYLLTESDQDKIFTKKKLKKIFNGIENYPAIEKKCLAEKEQKAKKKN